MKTRQIYLATALSVFAFSAAHAQNAETQNPAPSSPQAVTGGADGAHGFAGYVPSASIGGMSTGGSNVDKKSSDTEAGEDKRVQLNDGRQNSPQKVDGFNNAVEQNFPMTPQMLRQYKAIFDEQQRVILDRPQPEMITDSVLLSLEPGEPTPTIYIAPGMFTAIGVYDSTGQAWPVTQYVVGDKNSYQVIQLGDDSNSVTVTPTVPVGWTNMALVLKDEPKPVIVKLEVSNSIANTSRDIQVMKPGPNAVINTVSEMPSIRPVQQPKTDPIAREAGSPLLMAALSGVDLPQSAKPVSVYGVNAKAWAIGERLLIRSKSPLVSPSWSNSLAGPDGVYVYEIEQVPVALFSVNGSIVRADIDMP